MPVHLGDINFGLVAISKGMQQALDNVKKLGNMAEQSAKKNAKGQAEVTAQLLKQEAASRRAISQVIRTTDRMKELGNQTGQITALNKALVSFTGAMAKGQLTSVGFAKATEQFQAAIFRNTRQLREAMKAQSEKTKADKKSADETEANRKRILGWQQRFYAWEQREASKSEAEKARIEREGQEWRFSMRQKNTADIIKAEANATKAAKKSIAATTEAVAAVEEKGFAFRLKARMADTKAWIAGENAATAAAKKAGEDRVKEAESVAKKLSAIQSAFQEEQKRYQGFQLRTSSRIMRNTQEKESRAQAKAANEAAAQVAASLKASETAFKQYESAVHKATLALMAFQQQSAGKKGGGDLQLQAAVAAGRLQAIQRPNMTSKDVTTGVRAFELEMKSLQGTLKSYNGVAEKTVGWSKKIADVMHGMASSAVIVHGPLGGIATRLHAFAAAANSGIGVAVGLTAALGAAVYGIYRLSKATIDVQRDLQKTERTLVAVTGGTALASIEMGRLMELADRSGVAFKELQQPYAQWVASVAGTAMEGEKAWKTFEKFTFVASTFGLSAQQTQLAMRALNQMMSKGSVQAEELRGQFGEQIAGAFQNAAKAMGTLRGEANFTVKDLQKLMKEGKIDPVEFIPALMDQYIKLLKIDMSNAVEGVIQSENRWSNSQIKLFDAIDKTFGISKAYAKVLDSMTGFMNNYAKGIAAARGDTDKISNGLAMVKTAFDVAKTAGEGFLELLNKFGGDKLEGGFKFFASNVVKGVDIALNKLDELVRSPEARAKRPITLPSELFEANAAAIKKAAEVNAAAEAAARGMKPAAAGIQESFKGVGTALTGALPPLKEFVKDTKSWEINLNPSAVTQYYKDASYEVDRLKESLAAAEKEAKQFKEDVRPDSDTDKAFGIAQNTYKVKVYTERLKEAEEQLEAINRLQSLPTSRPSTGPVSEEKEAETRRRHKVVRELTQELERLIETEEKMRTLSPEAFEAWKETAQISKQVEDIRDKFADAGIPIKGAVTDLKEMEKIVKAVDPSKMEAGFRKTAEQTLATKRAIEQTVTPLQFMQKGFDTLATTGVNKFVDALMEGKITMETLRDIGKSVVSDLLKEFIKLAAIAPLKNMLFGTNEKTFGFLPGGAPGVGGLLGGLFSKSAKGNVFASGVSGYSNTIVDRPTIFPMARGAGLMGEAGPEAVMPLVRRGGVLGVRSHDGGGGGDSGGMVVQIYNQNGSRVTAKQEKQGDVSVLKVMVKDIMVEDLAQNGPYTRASNRTQGRRRFG